MWGRGILHWIYHAGDESPRVNFRYLRQRTHPWNGALKHTRPRRFTRNDAGSLQFLCCPAPYVADKAASRLHGAVTSVVSWKSCMMNKDVIHKHTFTFRRQRAEDQSIKGTGRLGLLFKARIFLVVLSPNVLQ